MNKEIEIPAGYEARIEGNKVIIEQKESDDERIRKMLIEVVNITPAAIVLEHREEMLAYLEKQKEQKPLSTEETELNSIAFLEQLGYTCVPPGAEQQPAEWGEEDEDYRHDILLTLEALRSCAGSTDTQIVYQHLIDWLKSLHPKHHWKPSEEQMGALYSVLPLSGQPTTLQSLYNDLKKLK